MQQNMPLVGGAVLLWLSIMIGIIGGYIIMLIALWRTMKAHEAIAQTLKAIARQLERPAPARPDAEGKGAFAEGERDF
jgi:hypothetical protein